jgi:hypothetical protein
MKKALSVTISFAILLAIVIINITANRKSGIEDLMQHRVGRYFDDCRNAMLDVHRSYKEQLQMQPQWCRQWWDKLPESKKLTSSERAEGAIPANQMEEGNPIKNEAQP